MCVPQGGGTSRGQLHVCRDSSKTSPIKMKQRVINIQYMYIVGKYIIYLYEL
jgi:hypothetical protein